MKFEELNFEFEPVTKLMKEVLGGLRRKDIKALYMVDPIDEYE